MSDERRERPRYGPLFLTVDEAAAELHLDAPAAETWLAARRLIRDVAGQRLVVVEDLVDAVRGQARGPVTSWRAAAEVLGMSEDTLLRHRRQKSDATKPWFADEAAVRRWWEQLHAPRARRASPPRKVAKKPWEDFDTPLDVKALFRELSKGKQ